MANQAAAPDARSQLAAGYLSAATNRSQSPRCGPYLFWKRYTATHMWVSASTRQEVAGPFW